MSIKYLLGKTWAQTTREERQYCSVLFESVRKRPNEFIRFLKRGARSMCGNLVADLSERTEWDVGFEVALGRDLPNAAAQCLGLHRKFDLTFFSERQIVVVEAKAQQRFSREELCRYQLEKSQLSVSLDVDVIFVGLCSSIYLKRKKLDLCDGLDAVLTWKQIAAYWEDDENFRRAECVYGK